MPTEELKSPSQAPLEKDWSKEIEIAEALCKQALESYKQVSIDRLSIQQTVIRNYLWLSVTILAAEFAFISKAFGSLESFLVHPCPGIVLVISMIAALVALLIGIRAMTGTNIYDPIDNHVEVFDYLTADGYDQGNHYAILKKKIRNTKESIDKAYNLIHKRGTSMRKMNKALIFSVCTGVFSSFLFFISNLT